MEVEVAKFEEWGAAGRTFDILIAGQTWHWVDPITGASKAARVLRPGGRIALFWNVMSLPPALGEKFSAVYRHVLPEFPFFQNGMPGGVPAYAPILDNTAGGLRHTAAFDEPERWQFDWERRYSRSEWVDAVPTFGGHSHIPSAKLVQLLEGIGEVVDAAGGSFVMGYNTVVLTARRTGPGLPAAGRPR